MGVRNEEAVRRIPIGTGITRPLSCVVGNWEKILAGDKTANVGLW
jgi:hypothetical protein